MALHGLPGSSSLVSISSSLLGELDSLLPGWSSRMAAKNEGIGGGGMSSMEGGGPKSPHSRPVESIQVTTVARHKPDPIKYIFMAKSFSRNPTVKIVNYIWFTKEKKKISKLEKK